MLIEVNGRKYRLNFGHLIYGLILLAFSIYILKDLSYNTAFVDEAIYATVGEEFLRGIFWESALSWMGGSYLYPIISALINRVYGLAGIRAFSYLCLLIAGVTASEIARKIAGPKTRVVTAAVFFSSASVLNLSALGTYDASSILFLSLAVFLGISSQRTRDNKRMALVIISSIAFFLAVLSKYIAIVFLPFVVLLVLEKGVLKTKWPLVWLVSFVLLLSAYCLFTLSSLIDFFTSDSFVEIKTRPFILKELFGLLNVFLIAFATMVFIFLKKHRHNYIFISLFFAGMMPLLYHVIFANFRSLWKHVVFTQFFWAPLVAWMVVFLYIKFRKFVKQKEQYSNASQLVYAAIIAASIFGLWRSLSLHWRFQRSWPSASASLEYLEKVRGPDDRIFAEASAVYKYHLFDGFEDPYSWASTWYIEYEGETGVTAMKKAIENQVFDYIILNGYYTRETSDELTELANIYYDKVLTDNYKVSGEYDMPTFVWARKGS